MTNAEISIQVSIAVLTALATLAAAYYGAKFAFDFQNKKNTENEINSTVKAANMAIFALMRSHHELTAINRQFIQPHINDADRHFSIPPSSSAIKHLDLQFNDLSFLLSSSNPNLLNKLALTQSDINTTIDMVNVRSNFHLKEFQPLLEKHHDVLNAVSDLAEMQEIIGARATHTLLSVTDAMVESVDVALKILSQDAEELYTLTKNMYPTHGIVRIIFNNPEA